MPNHPREERYAHAILMAAENSKQFEEAAWVEGFDADLARAVMAVADAELAEARAILARIEAVLDRVDETKTATVMVSAIRSAFAGR